MKTLILKSNETEKAAEILNSGGVVAIPTETVYGLAASIFNEKAAAKIFKAKGRPADNPLIVHISDLSQLSSVVSEFPGMACKLAEKFWPGPLTMILPKEKNISDFITAGLDSVAVRFPAHKIALEIISKTGPLAAPSANTSGRPSPTSMTHVLGDLGGKIEAVIDGGECEIGLESTVLSLLGDIPEILRPGAVTAEDLEKILGSVKVNKSIQSQAKTNEKVISPGMKYKHYSPRAKVIIVSGDYINFVNSKANEGSAALCFDEDVAFLKTPFVSLGTKNNQNQQAKKLFSALRACDEMGAKVVYARMLDESGIGFAALNRLLRAADFEVIEV